MIFMTALHAQPGIEDPDEESWAQTGCKKEYPSHHMGSCQNRGPLLGTLNNRCRSILGTQKGTIILTTTHTMALSLGFMVYGLGAFRDSGV